MGSYGAAILSTGAFASSLPYNSRNTILGTPMLTSEMLNSIPKIADCSVHFGRAMSSTLKTAEAA
jgi:hypothetical protein